MKANERRAYQTRAVRKMESAARKRGRYALLLTSPTGSGKTVIAVRFIQRLLRARKRVLFVAHTVDIVGQTYETLLSLGLGRDQVGVLMASDQSVERNGETGRDRVRPDAPVQVCGVQTLVRRAELPDADVVIVDEAHHAAADSYKSLVERYPKAKLYGLTATPSRMDGKGLDDVFDELYVCALPSELIARKLLAEPVLYAAPEKFRALQTKRMRKVRVQGGDYHKGELGDAMNHRVLVGNIVTEWKRLAQGRRTVVFASSVKHSHSIAARFRAAGVKAEHIDGEMDKAIVAAVLARLDRGETTVVCNYGLLAEGWDQPSVKCIVLARPTRSLVVYLQQTGRSSRPFKGQRPIVLDHAGNHARFGFPLQDREWAIEGVPKGDKAGVAPTRICPECEAVSFAGNAACVECGRDFPRAEAPEEIIAKLTRVESEKVLYAAKKIAARRGFADGWAARAQEAIQQAML